MTTARDFISLALKEAGVLGVGQTALPEDINDSFTILHRMLKLWQKKRWIVPNLIDVSAISNGAISNTIGPGQFFNTLRPDKIQSAYFKQLPSNGVNDVSYPLGPIWSREDYSKIALKNLVTWPSRYFYDNAFPYGNLFINPIPAAGLYELHLILKGPIGFTVELKNGKISANGAAYTNGAYLAVPFLNISSLGGGATADVTVAGGFPTIVTIHDPGSGYNIGDILTLDTTLMGNTGAGFLWTVTEVTDDLDAIFNMPSEYEEAIHHNLCVRLVAHYQMPVNPVQGVLAKTGLKTIRNSNFQMPQLQMPSSLRFNKGGGTYIYNVDAN